MDEKKHSYKCYIPIIIAMLFWGSMGIPSTYAVAEFTLLNIMCLRSGIAALFLFPTIKYRHKKILPAKEDVGYLLSMSIVGVVLCNYLYFFAVKNTSLVNVAILYALGPIFTAILALIFLKETIHSTRALGIVLAFFGVVTLVTKGKLSELLSIRFSAGDLAQIFSSLCLAVYTILSRQVKKTPVDMTVFWMMSISFLTTLPSLFIAGGNAMYVNVSWRGILSIIYLGVFCSGLGYLLQQKSIKLIGAPLSAAFLNGISPITILTATIFFGENISLVQIVSMCIIFLGLYLNIINK